MCRVLLIEVQVEAGVRYVVGQSIEHHHHDRAEFRRQALTSKTIKSNDW